MSNLAKTGLEEFGETLLVGLVLNEAREEIKKITEGIDNPVLQDAIESSLNVIAFGLLFKLIQKQEVIIDRLFAFLNTAAFALYGFGSKLKGKLNSLSKSKKMGRVGRNVFSMASQMADKRQHLARSLIIQGGNYLQAQSNASNTTGVYDSYMQTRSTHFAEQEHKLNFAASANSIYTQMMLFRAITGTFRQTDINMINKMLNRQEGGQASPLTLEDVNSLHNAIFITDSNGERIGLSEAFISFVNSQAYAHKKPSGAA